MANITKEERIQRLDDRIAKTEAKIAELKAKREKLARPSDAAIRAVLSKAKEQGMSPAEIASKLNLNLTGSEESEDCECCDDSEDSECSEDCEC